MYIAVCTDLSLPQQMVQVAHAAQECGIYFSSPQPDSDFMAICQFANEAELLAEAAKHPRMRIIREPDLRGRATAIASPPLVGAERKPFRRWKLWGSTPESRNEARVHADVDAMERELNARIALQPRRLITRKLSHGEIAHSFVGAPHALTPGESPGLSAISSGSSAAERRGSNAQEVAGSNPAPMTNQHLDRRNGKEDVAHRG